MKFVMVMIICFGGDCDAVFDPTSYFNSYDNCYVTALQTTQYMQQMYPQSSGEIHCYNEEQLSLIICDDLISFLFCVPGITRIHPLSFNEVVAAIHTDTTFMGSRGQ